MRKIIAFVLCLTMLIASFVCFGASASQSEIAISIDRHTLTLKDNIWMVYFVNSQNIPEGAESGVLIWDEPQQSYTIDSTTTCGQVLYKGVQPVANVDYDRYEYKNVAARDMATDYYAVAYVKIGNEVTYSALDKYSVLQYAFNQTQKFANDPEQTEFLELLDNMLDYGASSQKYFDHNTDRLANDTYYSITVNGGTLADGTTSGLYKEGDSITLIAPATNDSKPFSHWEKDGLCISSDREYTVTVGKGSAEYKAEYGENAVKLVEGQVVYNETFTYSDNTNSASTLNTIGWTQHTVADGAYKETAATFKLANNALYFTNNKSGRTDGYWRINALHGDTASALFETLYTLQYDITYTGASNAARFAGFMTEYSEDGKYYNSCVVRNGGYGNNQSHYNGSWLDYEAMDGTNLYAKAESDIDTDYTTIYNKLTGNPLDAPTGGVLGNKKLTVRVVCDPENGQTMYIKTAGMSNFVKVSQTSPNGAATPYWNTWQGTSIAFKIGARVDGIIDNVTVTVGDTTTGVCDHKYGKWTVKTPSTEDTYGKSYRICSVCQNKESRLDSLIVHDYITQSSTPLATPSLTDYSDFAAMATEGLLVPGIDEYIIPQGMDYWAEKGWMIISGYFKTGSDNPYGFSSSVISAVDVATGKMVGWYYLNNADGTDYTGHAGGVAVTSKNIFIANAKNLFRIPLSDLENAESGSALKFVEAISVPTNASFCNYSGGILWVGDFYYLPDYTTDSYRHMTNRDGNTYYAWCVGYELDNTTANEFKTSAIVADSYATPDYILSIDERIQGMTYQKETGHIVLSRSYGRANNSTLFYFDDVLGTTAHTTTTLNGVSVPVWFLDQRVDCTSITAIPMAEGITCINGNTYVLFESGAKYYADSATSKLPTDRVWVVDISKYPTQQ